MGYRRFIDRDGVTWEVRERSLAEWELQPVGQPGVAPVHAEPTIRGWMAAAGLGAITRSDLDPDRWLIVGRKPG